MPQRCRLIADRNIHGEDAWLTARRKYITATDVPVILRKNPYKSPFTLYNEKVFGCDTFKSADMQRGIDNELPILNTFIESTKVRGRQLSGLVASTAHSWLSCSPDALCYSRGVTYAVEIKCPRKSWGTPPEHYLIQLQTQMLVMGLSHGVLVWAQADGIKKTLRYHKVTADISLHEKIIDVSKKFHFCVDRRELSLVFW